MLMQEEVVVVELKVKVEVVLTEEVRVDMWWCSGHQRGKDNLNLTLPSPLTSIVQKRKLRPPRVLALDAILEVEWGQGLGSIIGLSHPGLGQGHQCPLEARQMSCK